MEAPKTFFELLIFFLTSYMADPSLSSHMATGRVMENIIAAHETFDPIQYRAEMRFQGFESDTFDQTRYCTISYRADADNALYGYDWKYEETFPQGYTYTIMALANGMYYIYKDDSTKHIGHRVLPNQINMGAYDETMRNYFMLDQVLEPFYKPSDEIILKDSTDYYILWTHTGETSTPRLVVAKATYLPVQTTTYLRDPEFDFLQILDITFLYDFNTALQPDSIFSVDRYKEAGFAYTFIENETEESATRAPFTLTPAQQQLLLDYPFITEQNDTQYIRNSDASYLLLDFWYASCVPCLKAMPEADNLAARYVDSGLKVIGLNCFDKSSRTSLVPKMRDKNIFIPLLFGERELVNALGITNYPSYFLITPDHKIEYIEGDINEVKKALAAIFDK
jgi:thiol-disulfide isomerase/thioredoxin